MDLVTGHFEVISTSNGLESIHTIKKNVMTAKKSKKQKLAHAFPEQERSV